MPLYIAKSGDLDRCYRCLTDSQRKDRATQLLIKYKSGALVTQLHLIKIIIILVDFHGSNAIVPETHLINPVPHIPVNCSSGNYFTI